MENASKITQAYLSAQIGLCFFSVQSWYKIPCQGTSLLILVRQEKSSSCQGGQLLKAGGFMPLRQQLVLAVQPQNHITWLFSSGKGPMFTCFLLFFFILYPNETSAHWTKMPFLLPHYFHLFSFPSACCWEIIIMSSWGKINTSLY